MKNFLTRVELHGAQSSDYTKLHDYMYQEKFFMFIRGDDGKAYGLPTAEYRSSGDLTTDGVRALACRAASKTGRAFSVIVVDYNSAAWVLTPL